MAVILSGQALANISGNDKYAVKYSGSSLGAQTINDYVDGRYNRTYSVHLRYTAGGTLAFKVYGSNEDVAYGSVTDWQDLSTTLLGAASITATAIKSFIAMYRWIKFEWVLTGTGNTLAYEIMQGW